MFFFEFSEFSTIIFFLISCISCWGISLQKKAYPFFRVQGGPWCHLPLDEGTRVVVEASQVQFTILMSPFFSRFTLTSIHWDCFPNWFTSPISFIACRKGALKAHRLLYGITHTLEVYLLRMLKVVYAHIDTRLQRPWEEVRWPLGRRILADVYMSLYVVYAFLFIFYVNFNICFSFCIYFWILFISNW